MAYIGTKDYFTEVSMGRVANTNAVNKFGYNLDVDTGSEQIIASFGGTFLPSVNVINTALAFKITYTNTLDGSTATGARSLIITYIDASQNEVTAIHTLGSTGTDTTAFTGFGVNRAVVYSNGGLGWNGGDIRILNNAATTIQASIPATKSVTQQALYHVGIGRTFLMRQLNINILKISGGSSPVVTVRGYSWSRVTSTRYQVYRKEIDTGVENSILDDFDGDAIKFTGREIIYFTAETNTNNTVVNLRFSGLDTITT